MTGRAGLLPPLLIAASFFLPTPEKLTAKADPTVRIEGITSLGTGTHIGFGMILTAAHVVDKGGMIEVEDQDGNTYQASLTFLDKANDVAVLQVRRDAPVRSSPIKCRKPTIGELIVTTGNPMGQRFITSWGRVSGAVREGRGVTIFPVDMTTLPGMSGGSIRDFRGNIIGVVSMVMTQPPYGTPLAVGYAVPSSTFCPLLKNAGVL
jgi:serine protease Do